MLDFFELPTNDSDLHKISSCYIIVLVSLFFQSNNAYTSEVAPREERHNRLVEIM